jgi:tetratricopeptide (TPR) repeat protein
VRIAFPHRAVVIFDAVFHGIHADILRGCPKWSASALFAFAALVTAVHARSVLQASTTEGSPDANPLASAPWIDRGLAAEHAGDLATAERDLLTAARLDRQYLPAWTLANFYFRRGDRGAFWPWARRAASLSCGREADCGSDDVIPLMQLADILDPGRALEHLTAVPPDRIGQRAVGLGDAPRLEHAYLDLLLRANRFDEAMKIARLELLRSTTRRSADDLARLRAATTRLIAANHVDDALEIWNAMAQPAPDALNPINPLIKPLINPSLTPLSGPLINPSLNPPLNPLVTQPVRTIVVTNGAFDTPPSGEGFDWRLPASPGVSAVWRRSNLDSRPGSQPDSWLDFTLDGSQPEACPLLEQIVPMPLRGKGSNETVGYRLRFEYSTDIVNASAGGNTSGTKTGGGDTGLHWALDSAESLALGAPDAWAGRSPEGSRPGASREPSWRDGDWTMTAAGDAQSVPAPSVSPSPSNAASGYEPGRARVGSPSPTDTRVAQYAAAHLVLFYRRDPGTARAEGRFQIRNIRLEPSSRSHPESRSESGMEALPESRAESRLKSQARSQ